MPGLHPGTPGGACRTGPVLLASLARAKLGSGPFRAICAAVRRLVTIAVRTGDAAATALRTDHGGVAFVALGRKFDPTQLAQILERFAEAERVAVEQACPIEIGDRDREDVDAPEWSCNLVLHFRSVVSSRNAE